MPQVVNNQNSMSMKGLPHHHLNMISPPQYSSIVSVNRNNNSRSVIDSYDSSANGGVKGTPENYNYVKQFKKLESLLHSEKIVRGGGPSGAGGGGSNRHSLQMQQLPS